MAPNVREIIEMEAQIWEALRRGDAKSDAALLTDDFLGVYPSGFWNKTAHCEQMKDGPIIAEYRLTDERLTLLSDNCVLLTYRAYYSWYAKPEKTEQMYISSVWQRMDGAWKNSFSQDTPAAS
jgi:hypothetical protein